MLAENECVCGPNVIGLRRAGYDSFARMAIRRAIKTYFFKGLNATNALAEIEKTPDLLPEVRHFVQFIRSTERGIMPGDPELTALGIRGVDEEKE
jgi:UDP-N-acetylglucosamine acyltransferase